MQKNVSVAHSGMWLCLLGSTLALVAFYLPYSSPPGNPFPPASLEDCLSSCTLLDRLFQNGNTGFNVVALSAGALLLLLLSIEVLAVLALFLPPPQWKSRNIYLHLTTLTLIGYLGTALYTLIVAWVGITLASTPTDDPNQETLSMINIGAWLIPLGLLLALIGGILLERRALKAGG